MTLRPADAAQRRGGATGCRLGVDGQPIGGPGPRRYRQGRVHAADGSQSTPQIAGQIIGVTDPPTRHGLFEASRVGVAPGGQPAIGE